MRKSTRFPILVGLIDADAADYLHILVTEITTARLAKYVCSSNVIIKHLQASGLWNPLEDLLSRLIKRM